MFAKYGCSYEKSKEILNAMIAVRTLYPICVRAVNTLQQLLVRRRSVMDAIKKLWKLRVDAVRTLYTRYYWQI